MQNFSIHSSDGKTALACYRTECVSPRALLQISHGMCEYFARYTAFAEFLAEQGILVFGHDHLGHGHTAPTADDLGFTGKDGGADHMVEDVHNLALRLKQEYPELPLILFGHSMGSFIAREVIARYGSTYCAAVICGTGGPDMPTGAGKLLARIIMLFRSERYRSKLLKKIAFAGYNKNYDDVQTESDWLTRDREVVSRYRADPLCNYTFTARGYYDLFTLLGWVSQKRWASRIPQDLPLLLISGEMDPVGGWGKGVKKVTDRLRAENVEVTLRIYPKMRHELINEIHCETVWKETTQWILEQLP